MGGVVLYVGETMVQWPAPHGCPCKRCGGEIHGRRKDDMGVIECKGCGATQGKIYAAPMAVA